MFVHIEIVLVYVDDCLCFGYHEEALDQLVAELKSVHQLDEQEISPDVYAYFGIELNMHGDRVELLQTGSTNKILKAMQMENYNLNQTPAIDTPLTANLDGAPFQEDWEYASVVGMLM